VGVDESVLVVQLAREPEIPIDKLTRSLLEIPGVTRVQIHVANQMVADEPAPLPSGGPSPVAQSSEPDAQAAPSEEVAPTTSREGYEIFPKNELFATLLADPRWPRFSASYQSYQDDDELDQVGAASFGETFPLVRSPDYAWGQWELAFQAGVFSVFDLEASSMDLVNSDFFVGLGVAHHLGDFTTLLRIYHQSSHLGDEYLLRNRVDRVNLSFEVVDLLVSFTPWHWLRVYGGGGALVHREPHLDRGLTQLGVELRSPIAYAAGYLRPLAGLDLQFRQESDWQTDLSLRAGVQLEHPALEDRRLQLLGEFYDGQSPNGQFFERDIQVLGIGLYLGF
jgi:hypothetical protein